MEPLKRHLGLIKDKIVYFQRFSIWFKLLLLIPVIGWLFAFNVSKYVPGSIRPHIDTTTLPYLEDRILLGYSLQHWPRNLIQDETSWKGLVYFLDFLSAFVYVIHFMCVWIFAAGIYLYYRKKIDENGKPLLNPWTFFWCWGLLNFFAVLTQLCWPTTPPWYLELHGATPPSYSMEGDPAGLENVDNLLQVPLFGSIYGSSPIVFGSFPSLHGAWPIMITLFTPSRKIFKVFGSIYATLVWWAAMYLNHHYLVDLLGGLFYTVVCYMVGVVFIQFFVLKFKDKIYGRNVFSLPRYLQTDSSGQLELEIILDQPRSPGKKKNVADDTHTVTPLLMDDNMLKKIDKSL